MIPVYDPVWASRDQENYFKSHIKKSMKSTKLSPIRDCSAFQPIFKAAASIVALLLLNMGGVASAGPIRLDTVTADAPGKILQTSMIWVPESPVLRGMPAAFRKVFQLAKVPQEAKLRIFADSRYILWINGTYVGRGPNRFHIGGPEYDTYNVAGHLKVGENLVAVFAFSTPS